MIANVVNPNFGIPAQKYNWRNKLSRSPQLCDYDSGTAMKVLFNTLGVGCAAYGAVAGMSPAKWIVCGVALLFHAALSNKQARIRTKFDPGQFPPKMQRTVNTLYYLFRPY